MTALLQALPPVLSGAGVPAAIVFLRVAAAVSLMPGLGETAVPVRVRLALAIGLTLAVWPAVPGLGGLAGGGPQPAALRCLFTETAAGLVIGLSLRLMVLALQTAGTMIAQATSLAQMFGGAGAEPMPAASHLMVAAGLALAMTFGLPVRAAGTLIGSSDLWPAGGLPDAAALRDCGLAAVSRSFGLAMSLAAPFLVAGLLANLALGAVNRAMPQLMVMMIGAPAMMLGVIGLMALAVPVGLGLWVRALLAVTDAPFAAGP
jgi:flagellar biosynthetic protein FliR